MQYIYAKSPSMKNPGYGPENCAGHLNMGRPPGPLMSKKLMSTLKISIIRGS